jgi:hypothetical protein
MKRYRLFDSCNYHMHLADTQGLEPGGQAIDFVRQRQPARTLEIPKSNSGVARGDIDPGESTAHATRWLNRLSYQRSIPRTNQLV